MWLLSTVGILSARTNHMCDYTGSEEPCTSIYVTRTHAIRALGVGRSS